MTIRILNSGDIEAFRIHSPRLSLRNQAQTTFAVKIASAAIGGKRCVLKKPYASLAFSEGVALHVLLDSPTATDTAFEGTPNR